LRPLELAIGLYEGFLPLASEFDVAIRRRRYEGMRSRYANQRAAIECIRIAAGDRHIELAGQRQQAFRTTRWPLERPQATRTACGSASEITGASGLSAIAPDH